MHRKAPEDRYELYFGGDQGFAVPAEAMAAVVSPYDFYAVPAPAGYEHAPYLFIGMDPGSVPGGNIHTGWKQCRLGLVSDYEDVDPLPGVI